MKKQNYYLVRVSRHFFADSSGARRVQYVGKHGFDGLAPLVPFGSAKEARDWIKCFDDSVYELANGECSRPSLVVVPLNRAPKDIRAEVYSC